MSLVKNLKTSLRKKDITPGDKAILQRLLDCASSLAILEGSEITDKHISIFAKQSISNNPDLKDLIGCYILIPTEEEIKNIVTNLCKSSTDRRESIIIQSTLLKLDSAGFYFDIGTVFNIVRSLLTGGI
jgi:hypothetical protein